MTVAMRVIGPAQADHFRGLFLQHIDLSYQAKSSALFDLIKATPDGIITRGQLNATLYPKLEPESIKTHLSMLKREFSHAATKACYRLSLVSPSGRGSASQAIYLATDAPWPVPPSTSATTNDIALRRHENVPAQAVDLTQYLVFVSYYGEEQELVEPLINQMEDTLAGKKGRKEKQIKFWLFRRTRGGNGIPTGENDHDSIQRAITQAQAGILMVSPRACGRRYIKEDEWSRFRDNNGNILKPFLPVLLSKVDEREDDLGVLGRIGKNRPQCFYLREQQQPYAWDKCLGNPGLSAQFVDQLIAELRRKLFEPQDVSSSLQNGLKRVSPLLPIHADYEEIKRRHVPAFADETEIR